MPRKSLDEIFGSPGKASSDIAIVRDAIGVAPTEGVLPMPEIKDADSMLSDELGMKISKPKKQVTDSQRQSLLNIGITMPAESFMALSDEERSKMIKEARVGTEREEKAAQRKISAEGNVVSQLGMLAGTGEGREALAEGAEYALKELPQTTVDVVREMAQGVPLVGSFADEAEARVRAGLPGRNYQEELSKVRQSREEFSEEMPTGVAEGLQIASGVIGGLGAAKAFGAAGAAPKTLLGKAGAGIAAGGIEGAVSGFGSGEGGFGRRMTGGIAGAGMGAALGGLAPVAGSAVKKIGKAGKNVANKIFGIGSRETVEDTVGILSRNLGVSADEAADYVKAMEKTPNKSLVDLNKNFQNKAALITRAGDEEAAGVIRKNLQKRMDDEAGRIAKSLNENLTGGSYYSSLDELDNAYKTSTAGLFNEAEAVGDIGASKITKGKFAGKSISEITSDPRIREAIDLVKSEMPERLGNLPDTDMKVLKQVKEVLDTNYNIMPKDSIEAYKRNMALDARKGLLDALDEVNPTYAQARKASAERHLMEKAMEEGENFTNKTAEEITRDLAEQPNAIKDSYRIGAKKKMLKDVFGAGADTSSAKKILRQKGRQGQFKALFDNENQYNNFIKQASDEIDMADTYRKITRQPLPVEDVSGISKGFNLLKNGLSAGYEMTVGKMADVLEKAALGLNKKNSMIMAKAMTDNKYILPALKQLAKNHPDQINIVSKILNPYVTGVASGGGVGRSAGERFGQPYKQLR